MNYNEALNFIHSRDRFGSRPGMERIEALCNAFDNPQDKLKYVHVAGTNGKGSTCSFVSSILEESGYKVGLFTSPYIERFEERIRINGENISLQRLSEVTLKVKDAAEAARAELDAQN